MFVTLSSGVREYSTDGSASTVLRAPAIRFRADHAHALKYLDSWFFKGVAVLYARFAAGSTGHVMLLPQRLSSTAARSRGKWRPLAVPAWLRARIRVFDTLQTGGFQPWVLEASCRRDQGWWVLLVVRVGL
ncbi:hypothetical protein [Roseateles sp.]|uniref:hypothetical protein n=1 Tax=Roseateles sp. TaxID=1971397 RepID=UPI00359F858C